jgi:hypothetical protein
MGSDRSDFLLEYYQLLADDIRRSESVISTVCGLQLGVTLILVGSRWLRGPMLPKALVMFVTQ